VPTDSRVKRSMKKDLLLEMFEFDSEDTSVTPSTATDPGRPEESKHVYTDCLTVLRFNKERAFFYVLAKQQVLKDGMETEVLWLGGIVSFCVLKCYERMKTYPKDTCVKISKPLDRRLKISVLLLHLSSVASVIVYQTFLSDSLLYAG